MKKQTNEIEHQEIKEVETSVEHPNIQDDDLRDTSYSPGENNYLNE